MVDEGRDWKPWCPFQVIFWMVIREPFAKRMKSRRPWPIMVLFVLSITEGRGPRPEGMDWS